jgi:hypothetical protein
MSPDECISALDRALAEVGEDVILRRVVGQAPNVINLDVTCRAVVKTWRLKEENLVAGIAQAVKIVSMSPTQIAQAQWPGGVPVVQGNPGMVLDASAPRRGDEMWIGGRLYAIDAVDAMAVDGVTVRYELQVLG